MTSFRRLSSAGCSRTTLSSLSMSTLSLLAPVDPDSSITSSFTRTRPARRSHRSFATQPRCDRPEMNNSAPGKALDNHVVSLPIFLPRPEEYSLADLCAHLHDRVQNFLNSPAPTELIQQTQKQTVSSLAVLDEALNRYSLDEIALSYNGGKDCLVLLILLLVALHRRFGSSSQEFPKSLSTVYMQSEDPFTEVDDFVSATVEQYHLKLETLPKASMKVAFAKYLHDNASIKAILVGTRRTDPHGAKLGHFTPTDQGWPEFMRCHPVIDWNYRQIWAFILQLDIPYCPLYDEGYTSLGGTSNTLPNPKLRISNTEGREVYQPAYELLDDDAERLGRP